MIQEFTARTHDHAQPHRGYWRRAHGCNWQVLSHGWDWKSTWLLLLTAVRDSYGVGHMMVIPTDGPGPDKNLGGPIWVYRPGATAHTLGIAGEPQRASGRAV